MIRLKEIGVLCLLSITAQAEMSEYTFTFENERYSVFVLNGDGEPASFVPKDHPEYIIRKSAYRLAKSEYEKLGFKSNPELLALMTASRSLVLITEYGKPENAYHMKSVAKGAVLPIEQRLLAQGIDLDLHKPRYYAAAPKVGLRKEGDTSRVVNNNIERTLNIQRSLTRTMKIRYRPHLQNFQARWGNVEIKTFVKSGDSPRGFTPLIIYLLNAHDLLSDSGVVVEDTFKRDVISQPRRVPFALGSIHLVDVPYKLYDHGDGVHSPFVNRNYINSDAIAVSFTPIQTRYLIRHLGFQVIHNIEDPSRAGEITTVLRQNVESYVGNTHLKLMEGREGRILKNGQLSFVSRVSNVDWKRHPRARPFSLEILYPTPKKSCPEIVRKLSDPRRIRAEEEIKRNVERHIKMFEGYY